ncbi:cold-shock protein [Streptomyces gulbargensis]|uniref:Cold-shock protein n=1 Tax=Streptomyces gulbargensis TaxID=364901 RepID=A0ABP7LLN6_9ACTN
METGIVKWFNDAKGYGFISSDSGGADLYASSSEIKDGSHTLRESQRVSFVVKVGPEGKQQATNIQPL